MAFLSQLSAGSPRFRVIQYKGRRFGIQLEPPFWTALEDMAAANGVRLNALVAEVAAAEAGGKGSLASRLRTLALAHVTDQRDVARLAATGASLAEVIADCPAPAFVVDDQLVIASANSALKAWFGPRAADPVGRPLESILRLSLGHPIRDVLGGQVAEQTYTGKAIHMGPGVLAVKVLRARRLEVMPGRLGLLVFLE